MRLTALGVVINIVDLVAAAVVVVVVKKPSSLSDLNSAHLQIIY